MSNPQILQQLSGLGWCSIGHGTDSGSASAESFQDALQICIGTFPSDEVERWMSQKLDVFSVSQAVEEAQQIYERKKRCKALKWLTRLSARITLYGSALDMLAQHHPEYLALVWGSLKFVVIGIMNQEELVKELAKALCRIGDVLPQAELQLLLYPTATMKELVTTLYIQIIKFARRAMKWYNESRPKHIISSITRPYSLRFKDMVDSISETSRRLEKHALSISMAELRQTRLELQESRREQQSLYEIAVATKQQLDAYHTIQHASQLDTNRRVCEIQFSMLMSFMSASPLATPELSMNYFMVRRNRNRRRGLDHSSYFQDAPQLRVWESQSESSQIAVYGGHDTRQAIRDFAVDAIELIKEAQIPVIWALDMPHSKTQYTAVDVIKYLVSQVLRMNHRLLDERSAALNAARFQSATTVAEWLSILGCVLEGLPQAYFIIDLGLLQKEMGVDLAWSELFEKFFEALKERGTRTIIKVAFLGTRSSHRGQLGEFDQGRILQLPGKRRSGRVTKSTSSNASRLRGPKKKKFRQVLQPGGGSSRQGHDEEMHLEH